MKLICNLLYEDKSIPLVIIDSVMAHYRLEYSGRSMLPERQHRLNIFMSTLSKIARIYKVAVVITNQVQSNPSGSSYFSREEISSGGNILNHVSTHRIQLRKTGFGYVYATIIKSPYHSSSAIDVSFIIKDKGVYDI